MISDRSRSSLETIFSRSVCANLALNGGEVVISPETGLSASELLVDSVYMITVASFHFKVVMLFGMPASPEVEAYYSKPASGLGFHDVFPELCNLCGGAVNRELARQYEHLGLSTPNRIEPEGLEQLEVLRPAFVSCHRVSVDHSVCFRVVLALCAYAPVDIVCPPAEAQSAGELELL